MYVAIEVEFLSYVAGSEDILLSDQTATSERRSDPRARPKCCWLPPNPRTVCSASWRHNVAVVRAMAESTAGEHHLPMPAHGAGCAGSGDTPEKQLNGFVRVVALIERVGNALGTLAFTWATVVLLGGYPTVLRKDSDFWFSAAIVFLEASR